MSTYRTIKKDKLYLKLMVKGFPKAREKNNFFNEVLSLMEL